MNDNTEESGVLAKFLITGNEDIRLLKRSIEAL